MRVRRADARTAADPRHPVDEDTGHLLWQVTVLDADEQAGRLQTAVSVQSAARVRPVPPENKTPFPWTPVEFVGLTALAYVDDSGGVPRVAWSFRAADMLGPGEAAKAAAS